jgi:two-component system, chemotaxis family, CheB/CheR fusion protein
VRVWSAGCASGQEPYSVAMLFAEQLGPEELGARVKVYATDVDEEALTQARQGSYDEKATADMPESLLERYFEADNGRHALRKELRRAVIFGRNDLVQDAPISRVDLLLCRNTLMYFHAETQERIVNRFHFALNHDGVLFLGTSEMLTRHADLFRPMDPEHRLFTKVSIGRPRHLRGPAGRAEPADPGDDRRDWMRHAVADASPIAQVVIDAGDRVVAANREARSLFGLTDGDVGRPLRELRLSYRPADLRSAVDQIRREPQTVEVGEVDWRMTGGETRRLEIRLTPLLVAGTVEGISILFNDTTRLRLLEEDLATIRSDAEAAYEELQSTTEELETTNEELQSTNEELETTNEELQSTNEELETTNEELQSTNEELATVNEQLRGRTAEVDSANAFLEGILTGLPFSVIVVDRELEVQLWNRQSEELWGLRSDEVRGQHLLDLDTGLPVGELEDPIRACLSGGRNPVALEFAATTRRGHAVEVRASCRPLGMSGGLRGAIVLLDTAGSDGA